MQQLTYFTRTYLFKCGSNVMFHFALYRDVLFQKIWAWVEFVRSEHFKGEKQIDLNLVRTIKYC